MVLVQWPRALKSAFVEVRKNELPTPWLSFWTDLHNCNFQMLILLLLLLFWGYFCWFFLYCLCFLSSICNHNSKSQISKMLKKQQQKKQWAERHHVQRSIISLGIIWSNLHIYLERLKVHDLKIFNRKICYEQHFRSQSPYSFALQSVRDNKMFGFFCLKGFLGAVFWLATGGTGCVTVLPLLSSCCTYVVIAAYVQHVATEEVTSSVVLSNLPNSATRCFVCRQELTTFEMVTWPTAFITFICGT